MNHPLRRYALGVAFLCVSGIVQAHPGHTLGALDGIVHPWQGLDHLLAAAGVGWWAARLGAARPGGRARMVLPCTFVGAMALGMAAALAGLVLPLHEEIATWSVLALGLLIARAGSTSPIFAAACVGIFALAHGAAHCAGLPVQPSTLAFAIGALSSTALLHAGGLAAAGALAGRGHWLRAGGLLLAGGGALLIAA